VHLITEPKRIVVQDAMNEEPGQVTRKDQSWVNWLVDIKREQSVSFSRKLNLSPEEGLFWIQAQASTPSLFAANYINIYITHEGGKVYLSGTPIPVTPGPELVVTLEPSQLETLQAMPTVTPFPTLTAAPATETPPAYPPPSFVGTTTFLPPDAQGTPAYPPPPGSPYP
jgi:hypothetical protein